MYKAMKTTIEDPSLSKAPSSVAIRYMHFAPCPTPCGSVEWNNIVTVHADKGQSSFPLSSLLLASVASPEHIKYTSSHVFHTLLHHGLVLFRLLLQPALPIGFDLLL